MEFTTIPADNNTASVTSKKANKPLPQQQQQLQQQHQSHQHHQQQQQSVSVSQSMFQQSPQQSMPSYFPPPVAQVFGFLNFCLSLSLSLSHTHRVLINIELPSNSKSKSLCKGLKSEIENNLSKLGNSKR